MRRGEVVDGQGKPIAAAAVVFYAPPVVYGKGDPVEAQTKTDAAGKFNLITPPVKRVPESQPVGPTRISVEFESGPLAGLMHATTSIDVRK
jgi:hypothetical protein